MGHLQYNSYIGFHYFVHVFCWRLCWFFVCLFYVMHVAFLWCLSTQWWLMDPKYYNMILLCAFGLPTLFVKRWYYKQLSYKWGVKLAITTSLGHHLLSIPSQEDCSIASLVPLFECVWFYRFLWTAFLKICLVPIASVFFIHFSLML